MEIVITAGGRQEELDIPEGNGRLKLPPLPQYHQGDLPLPQGGCVVVRNARLREKNPFGVTGFAKRFAGWVNRDLTVAPAPGSADAGEIARFLESIGLRTGEDYCTVPAQWSKEMAFPGWLGLVRDNGGAAAVRHTAASRHGKRIQGVQALPVRDNPSPKAGTGQNGQSLAEACMHAPSIPARPGILPFRSG